MDYKKTTKTTFKYVCEICDFSCSKKQGYERHLLTRKHEMITNKFKKNVCFCGKRFEHRQNLYRHKKSCVHVKNAHHDEKWIKMDKKWIKMDNFQKMSIFEKNENSECKKMHFCECGKTYKYPSGLSKHKKTCKKSTTNIVIKDESNSELKMMFIELMKQNSEVLDKCTELAEKPTTINNTTNNNTQFNVMNYLNTECKDAMNLTDFIESFEFSIKDLELLNTKGYQEVMQNTFIKQLCDMDKTKRPIHCSDKKRKSFYLKDNDVWEKDKDNEKLIRGMKNLSFIHNNALNKWKNKNSDWNSDEKKQLFYCNSIIELAKCDKEKERNKIINKLIVLSIK